MIVIFGVWDQLVSDLLIFKQLTSLVPFHKHPVKNKSTTKSVWYRAGKGKEPKPLILYVASLSSTLFLLQTVVYTQPQNCLWGWKEHICIHTHTYTQCTVTPANIHAHMQPDMLGCKCVYTLTSTYQKITVLLG